MDGWMDGWMDRYIGGQALEIIRLAPEIISRALNIISRVLEIICRALDIFFSEKTINMCLKCTTVFSYSKEKYI